MCVSVTAVLGGEDAGELRARVVGGELRVLDGHAEEAGGAERLDLCALCFERAPEHLRAHVDARTRQPAASGRRVASRRSPAIASGARPPATRARPRAGGSSRPIAPAVPRDRSRTSSSSRTSTRRRSSGRSSAAGSTPTRGGSPATRGCGHRRRQRRSRHPAEVRAPRGPAVDVEQERREMRRSRCSTGTPRSARARW